MGVDIFIDLPNYYNNRAHFLREEWPEWPFCIAD